MTNGPILALLVAGLFSASRPSLFAEAGPDGIQVSKSVGAPTLETLQVGLEDMLDRLSLTHRQREQVERIMAPKQAQKIAGLMTRRAVELENRANDY
jgi:Spy/CpxP family protein refolding chaperone